MAFWSENFATLGTDGNPLADPKRKFRFKVEILGIATDAVLWWAKTANKPSYTIAATEHKYLNHTFYYPGTVTWNEVVMTFVDPAGDQDMASLVSQLVIAGGYHPPAAPSTDTEPHPMSTMTKGGACSALNSVKVTQIDGNGADIDSWTLYNAFITDVKYGELAYGDDELVEVSLTFRYDWGLVEYPSSESGGGSPTGFMLSTGVPRLVLPS